MNESRSLTCLYKYNTNDMVISIHKGIALSLDTSVPAHPSLPPLFPLINFYYALCPLVNIYKINWDVAVVMDVVDVVLVLVVVAVDVVVVVDAVVVVVMDVHVQRCLVKVQFLCVY